MSMRFALTAPVLLPTYVCFGASCGAVDAMTSSIRKAAESALGIWANCADAFASNIRAMVPNKAPTAAPSFHHTDDPELAEIQREYFGRAGTINRGIQARIDGEESETLPTTVSELIPAADAARAKWPEPGCELVN